MSRMVNNVFRYSFHGIKFSSINSSYFDFVIVFGTSLLGKHSPPTLAGGGGGGGAHKFQKMAKRDRGGSILT